MRLDTDDRKVALDVLHSCGIEGHDAVTSLATVERLVEEPDLRAWAETHVGASPRDLIAQFGYNAARAAQCLLNALRRGRV